jgi:hypothetical protein
MAHRRAVSFASAAWPFAERLSWGALSTHGKVKPQRRLHSDFFEVGVAAACLEMKIEYRTRARGISWTRPSAIMQGAMRSAWLAKRPREPLRPVNRPQSGS